MRLYESHPTAQLYSELPLYCPPLHCMTGQEFAPELASLQVDPSDKVRKYLAELMEQAAAAAPQPAVLQPAASCLAALVRDANTGVAKRAIPAAAAVFRTSFALAAAQASCHVTPLQWKPSDSLLYFYCMPAGRGRGRSRVAGDGRRTHRYKTAWYSRRQPYIY